MSLIGWFHTIIAIVALLAGAWNLLQPKGTPTHRWIGRVFGVAVVGLNVSALMIYHIDGRFGIFHYLALVSLTLLAAALLPVLLRRPRRYWLDLHYFGISLVYAGLVAPTASELLFRVPFLRSIVGAGPFAIFRAGAVLGQISMLLFVALFAWCYRSQMAQLRSRTHDVLSSPGIASSGSLAAIGEVLILLGTVTFISHATLQFWPATMVSLSGYVGLLTITATLAIACRRRAQPADLRWLAAYFFLLLFGAIWSSVLGGFGWRALLAFRPSLIIFGVVVVGVFAADALVLPGLAAATLLLVGYHFAGHWLPLWVAVIAGGTEAWAGWRLRTPRQPDGVVAAARSPVQATT